MISPMNNLRAEFSMKKYCQIVLALLLCALFTACNSSSENEGYLVKGQTISEFPSPSLVEVSGANGSFTSGSTDADGSFSMLVPEPPPYHIRASSMQSDYSSSPALEAWCESSECHITPWSTLILRLMGKHDYREASELLKRATGFRSDPFIHQGQVEEGARESFLHEIFGDLLNGGDLRGESGSGLFSTPPPPELETSTHSGEGIFIQNAGLVITSSYFPMLFERLGLLSDSEFTNRSAQEDAVYFLQYLATGGLGVAERELVLNKILSGIDIDSPIKSPIQISPAQQKIIRSLLVSINNSWPPMQNAAPHTLQNDFLTRDGVLYEEEHRWVLRVERRAIDIILHRLPLSFSTIRHPWMDKPLIVEWQY